MEINYVLKIKDQDIELTKEELLELSQLIDGILGRTSLTTKFVAFNPMDAITTYI